MAIFNDTFSVYERLASAKMRSLISQINAHTHDGTNGVQIAFSSLSGLITNSMLAPGAIDGTSIANNSITTNHIVDGTILWQDLDHTSIFLEADGTSKYAYYAP